MIVEYKAKLRSVEHGEAHVHINRTLEGVYRPLLAPVFEAILRNMKETDEESFYLAMGNFAEHDFYNAAEWMQEHRKI